MTTRFAYAILLAIAALPVRAQDYQGAAAAIKQIANPAASAKPDTKDPWELLQRDLDAFSNSNLPPVDAAREWLTFVDRYAQNMKTVGPPTNARRQRAFQEILAALPPPSSWKAITGSITAKHATPGKKTFQSSLMLLLAHLLSGDVEAAWRETAAMRALAAKLPEDQKQSQEAQIFALMQTLASISGNKARQAMLFDLELKSPHMAMYRGRLEWDMVSILGSKKAEFILRRMLITSPTDIQVSGAETKKLARKLALELVGKLKAPQWSLCDSLDSLALYEALSNRFYGKAVKGASPYDRAGQGAGEQISAQSYYLAGLILAGNTKKASRVVADMRGMSRYLAGEAIEALRQSGHSKAVYSFLRAELARDPTLPLWEVFIPVATELGQANDTVTMVRTVLARKDLSSDTSQLLRNKLSDSLLAADRVEEGIAALRQTAAAAAATPVTQRMSVKQTVGMQLARIGKLEKRPALIEEGIRLATADAPREDFGSHPSSSLADLLFELGRGAEAEKVLFEALSRATSRPAGGLNIQGRQELVEICGLYHRAGRHEDVVALLDTAPNWFARDLGVVSSLADSHGVPLGYMAAAAFAKTGRSEIAARTLESVIRNSGGFDRAYALLVELRGSNVLPFLDELYLRDRFEERPLIWKAHVLLKDGKLEEAEKAAREAISIDPSDGEQGKGDRMRVYGILADIREARGDAAQATLYRGAVRAVRMSEDADDFAAAGLLTRSIAMYKQSLTYFADAYCIQSRLAIKLAEDGKIEEAEAHYRRAYELMPDSFGRMESHCFGCEGVFKGSTAVKIAEKVFADVLAKTPNKPQAHYLLGQLRSTQGRHSAALNHYRSAVKLDPLYLNAWQQIIAIGRQSQLPAADMDAANFQLLRLDPLGKHASPSFENVRDLAKLWTEVEAARKLQMESPRVSLYPLPASVIGIEKLEKQFEQEASMYGMTLSEYLDLQGDRSYAGGLSGRRQVRLSPPGKILSEHQLLSSISQMLDSEFQR